MKITGRISRVLMAAALLAGICAVNSMAASKTKITSVRLNLEDNLVRGGGVDADEIEFNTNDDKYIIAGWEFVNDGLVWTGTDVPRVKVRLETEDDYSFSVSKDKIKVKGAAATVHNTYRESSQALEITFNLLPMSKRVGPIDYAYLNGSVATWGPAEGATAYKILLICDSKGVGSSKITADTTYDFGLAMRKDGEYSYRVNGVGDEGTKDGPVLISEEVYKSSEDKGASASAKLNNSSAGSTNQAAAGAWIQDLNGWRWQRTDGSFAAGQWELINEKWYFFNDNTYMATGWVHWNSRQYYMGPEGDMWVSCQTPDGFTLNADGTRQ